MRGFYIAFGTFLFIVIGDLPPTTMHETYTMIFVSLVLATVISAVQGTAVSQGVFSHAACSRMPRIIRLHGFRRSREGLSRGILCMYML